MKTLYHRTTAAALGQITKDRVIKAQYPQHIGGCSVRNIRNKKLRKLRACCRWLLKKLESNKRVLWLLDKDKDKDKDKDQIQNLAGSNAGCVIEIHMNDCDYKKYVRKPRSLSGLISRIIGKLSGAEVLCINRNLIIKSLKYKNNDQKYLIVEVTILKK